MATGKFTGEGKKKIFDLMCSARLTPELRGQLPFISVLNIFISISAFLGNSLILAALRKESSLHPPSKLLLRNLATTDLGVGIMAEPLYVAFLMSLRNEQLNICRYAKAARLLVGNILYIVSLSTVTAISVDRLLALLLGLRYKQVVTLKRTYVIVITFWILPITFLIMYFWNAQIAYSYGIMATLLCLVTSMFSYTKIFLKLRHHQSQVHGPQEPNQANQLMNIARYRKAVFSALWLQLTLVACYLPNVVVALIAIRGPSSSFNLAWCYTLTLVYLNSSLHPILYCWKINGVRQAVKDTIRQVLCCSSS